MILEILQGSILSDNGSSAAPDEYRAPEERQLPFTQVDEYLTLQESITAQQAQLLSMLSSLSAEAEKQRAPEQLISLLKQVSDFTTEIKQNVDFLILKNNSLKQKNRLLITENQELRSRHEGDESDKENRSSSLRRHDSSLRRKAQHHKEIEEDTELLTTLAGFKFPLR